MGAPSLPPPLITSDSHDARRARFTLMRFATCREKILRGLIARTREWANIDLCRQLAVLAETRGQGDEAAARLAAALRARRVADLRKHNMLYLCREWGYKSDVWKPRGDSRRSNGGQRAHAPPAAAPGQMRRGAQADLAVAPLPALAQPLTAEVLRVHIMPRLHAVATKSFRCMSDGVAAKMQLQAQVDPQYQARLLAEDEGSVAGITWLAGLCGEAIRQTTEALGPPPGGVAPAAALAVDDCALFCFDSGPTPIERFLSLMCGVMGATHSQMRAVYARENSPAGTEELVTTWLGQGSKGNRTGVQMLGQLQLLHAQARIGAVSEYAQVAALLGEVVRSYTSSCASLFEASARHLKSLGVSKGERQASSIASRIAAQLPLPESADRVLRVAALPQTALLLGPPEEAVLVERLLTAAPLQPRRQEEEEEEEGMRAAEAAALPLPHDE